MSIVRKQMSKESDGPSNSLLARLLTLKGAIEVLARTDSLEDIKDIRNKAEAVRQYVRNAKAGLDLQNKAAELKLRAERRAGEILRSLPIRGGYRDPGRPRRPLEALGISQNQSTRWQKEAAVPEEEFCKLIDLAREGESGADDGVAVETGSTSGENLLQEAQGLAEGPKSSREGEAVAFDRRNPRHAGDSH